MNGIHETMGRQGLYRPRDERAVAGVFTGLGRRFGLDPWPSRFVFPALMLVVPGSQILLYPVLWVLMPGEKPGTVATSGPVPSGGPVPKTS